MILTTDLLDTAILFAREGVTKYEQERYEHRYDEVVRNGRELIAVLEAMRKPYNETEV